MVILCLCSVMYLMYKGVEEVKSFFEFSGLRDWYFEKSFVLV